MTSSPPGKRRGSGRQLDLGGSESLLAEMYSAGPLETEEELEQEAARPASRSPRRRRQEVEENPPSVPAMVDTRPSPAPVPVDATPPRARRLGNRVPDGKKKHTIYIPEEVAAALDAAADALVEQLGGMVPRHRVLSAIIAVGIQASKSIRAELRAEVLNAVDGD